LTSAPHSIIASTLLQQQQLSYYWMIYSTQIRAVMVFKTKTEAALFFPKATGTETVVFGAIYHIISQSE